MACNNKWRKPPHTQRKNSAERSGCGSKTCGPMTKTIDTTFQFCTENNTTENDYLKGLLHFCRYNNTAALPSLVALYLKECT